MTALNGTYRELRLDNGMLVALQDTPTQTVAGRLKVLHGKAHEKEEEQGIAHLLEHVLVTGGSKKYDPVMSNQICNQFGNFNAFTSLSDTFFPVDMLREDTKTFLDYISDSVFSPKFDENKFNEEKGRVIREIADAKSNPAFKDMIDHNRAFYGHDSLYSQTVVGNEKIVGSASVEDLKRFYERGYKPNNSNLILVGALPKDIEDMVRDYFGELKPGDIEKLKVPQQPKLSESKILHVHAPELYNPENPKDSGAQVGVSISAPKGLTDETYATEMLTSILGGIPNSLLHERVSQKEGFAYGIGANYTHSESRGLISIYGTIHAERSEEAIDAIFDEMRGLREDLVSEDKLAQIKRNLRYHTAKTYETNEGHINAIEFRWNTGLTIEEHLKRFAEVTPERIRDVARKYLPQDRENGKYVMLLRDPLKK